MDGLSRRAHLHVIAKAAPSELVQALDKSERRVLCELSKLTRAKATFAVDKGSGQLCKRGVAVPFAVEALPEGEVMAGFKATPEDVLRVLRGLLCSKYVRACAAQSFAGTERKTYEVFSLDEKGLVVVRELVGAPA